MPYHKACNGVYLTLFWSLKSSQGDWVPLRGFPCLSYLIVCYASFVTVVACVPYSILAVADGVCDVLLAALVDALSCSVSKSCSFIYLHPGLLVLNCRLCFDTIAFWLIYHVEASLEILRTEAWLELTSHLGDSGMKSRPSRCTEQGMIPKNDITWRTALFWVSCLLYQ